jgi:hypothetical protein
MHMLSTIRSSNSIPEPTGGGQEQPVGVLHDVCLVDHGDLLAAVVLGVLEGIADDPLRARDADGLDRHAGFVAAALDAAVGTVLVDIIDQRRGSRLARLELDARIEVLGVFADDHQVDGHVVEEAADAGILLARPHAGVQPQGLAEIDIDTAETRAHRRGDGGLQGTAGAADALEHGVGDRVAGAGHEVHARLLHVPMDIYAGGVNRAAGRFGQFRPDAIAGNQGYFVRHATPRCSYQSRRRFNVVPDDRNIASPPLSIGCLKPRPQG